MAKKMKKRKDKSGYDPPARLPYPSSLGSMDVSASEQDRKRKKKRSKTR